MRPKPVGLA